MQVCTILKIDENSAYEGITDSAFSLYVVGVSKDEFNVVFTSRLLVSARMLSMSSLLLGGWCQ